MGVSVSIASSRRFTDWRNALDSAPSLMRWSKDRQTFIIDLMAMASPFVESGTTTGRFWIASVVRMAAWGGLMMGWETVEPRTPVLFRVNVPPWTSSRVRRRERAREVRSATRWARPAMLNCWASWITGTISPSGPATAMPMFMRLLRMMASPSQEAFSVGFPRRASTTILMTKGR